MVRTPLPEPWRSAKALAPAAEDGDHERPDRMGDAGDPRRPQRMKAAQKARLENPRADLCRPDQGARGNGLDGCRAGGFEDTREVHRHRAGDRPGRGEDESQKDHGAVERDMRLDGRRRRLLGALHLRQHQEVERQADQDVAGRPGKAGVAPADMRKPQAVSGQPTVEANPAISVMPVIEPRASVP